MKIEDLEKVLRNAKFLHLADDVLISYRDDELDEISRRQADAHLDLCLICERRLLLFREERAALDGSYENRPEDIALSSAEIELRDRLTEYLRKAVLNWQDCFRQLVPVGGADRNEVKVWDWQSEDGVLVGHATLETTAALRIHFTSNDASLDGARLKIRVGVLTQEATLKRVSDSEVRASVEVPRRKRPRDLTDISIEVA